MRRHIPGYVVAKLVLAGLVMWPLAAVQLGFGESEEVAERFERARQSRPDFDAVIHPDLVERYGEEAQSVAVGRFSPAHADTVLTRRWSRRSPAVDGGGGSW